MLWHSKDFFHFNSKETSKNGKLNPIMVYSAMPVSYSARHSISVRKI